MGPLDGTLVVALEQAVAGPFCTARLAQAGARVIKIERAEGDNARGYDAAALGDASYFTWLNQGKESVELNIKSEEGRALLTALLVRADVMVQNFAPGAIDRAGFDYDRLVLENPSLIRCDISGYGSDPKNAHRRGYDMLVQAESGLIASSGVPNDTGRIGVSICDIGTGMTAYQGVLEALLHRTKTGKGSQFAVSLFDVAADWMNVPYTHAKHGGGAPEPMGLKHPTIAPYGGFDTADGQTILIAIQNEREWSRLCTEVLSDQEFLEDPRFESNIARCSNRNALDERIARHVRKLTAAQLQHRLDNAQIAAARVTNPQDLPDHPALRTEHYRNTNGIAVEMPARPIVWNMPRPMPHAGAPCIGQHTDQVVQEFMGSVSHDTAVGAG